MVQLVKYRILNWWIYMSSDFGPRLHHYQSHVLPSVVGRFILIRFPPDWFDSWYFTRTINSQPSFTSTITSSSIFIRVPCVVRTQPVKQKNNNSFFIIFLAKLIICSEDMTKGVANRMVKFRVVMLIVHFKIYSYMMI